MPRYKLAEAAKQDLQRIYQYGFEHFGEEQADRYFWGFIDCFERIAESPLQYQSIDYIRLGYRRCVFASDTIYFRVNSTGVEIMAIIGGQELDEWL